MKQTTLAILFILSCFPIFSQDATIEVDFSDKRQEIVGMGTSLEGYHTVGGSEVLKASLVTLLEKLPSDIVRSGIHIPGWELSNDNDDPNEIDFDGYATTSSPMINSFNRIKLLKDDGYKVWLFAMNMTDWNVTDETVSLVSKRKVKSIDEFAESICAYLLWAKEEYGAEVDWISLNEPTIATENNYGGYYLAFTAEEHAEMIKKTSALFEKHGINTQWIAAIHKVYPSELEHAQELYADEDTRAHLYGFEFHGYFMQDHPDYLASWGEFIKESGLKCFCGETDYHNVFWEYSTEEKAMWNPHGTKTALLYAHVLNHAYVSAALPWYSHSPCAATPYRYVAYHYNHHLTAGYQVVGSTTSNTYIHSVAAEKEDDWCVMVFNQYSTISKTVTISNLPGTTAQVYASYEDNYAIKMPDMTIENGTLTITLEPNGLYSIGNNLAELDALIVGEEEEVVIPETNVEAEDGTVGGGSAVSSSITGFTGDGYVDFGSENSWNEVVMTVPTDGSYDLYVRYASASDRPCDVYVNDEVVTSYAFGSTGGFSSWEATSFDDMAFKAGDNTVKLVANSSSGGPNVDSYYWTSDEASIQNIKKKVLSYIPIQPQLHFI